MNVHDILTRTVAGGDGENTKAWSSTTCVGGTEDGQFDIPDQSIYTEEDYKDVRYDLYALSVSMPNYTFWIGLAS